MAAIYREDSRISPSDFTDRILLKARCENRSYQIRNLVDHLRAPMIPWGSRNGSKDFDEKLLADLTPAQIHHNTTWGVPERTSEELRQLVSSENKQSNGSKRKMEEVVESTKGSKKQKCEGTGPHGVMTQKKRKRSAHAESMAPEGGQTVSFDEDYADVSLENRESVMKQSEANRQLL